MNTRARSTAALLHISQLFVDATCSSMGEHLVGGKCSSQISQALNKALNKQYNSSNMIGPDVPPGDLDFVRICRDGKSTFYFVFYFEKEVNNLVTPTTPRGQMGGALGISYLEQQATPLGQAKNMNAFKTEICRDSIGSPSRNSVNFNPINPNDMNVNVN
eukprot:jgi/Psemu1/35461/gm1.35461_g